ncbi:MAG: SUMF1/EgtB/PvdO family nonheme iron enzyme [Chloroflexota bacterium]
MKKLILLLVLLLLASCSAETGEEFEYIETGIDADAWVEIPAGEFLMGQHEHVTDVGSFEIMLTDVTNEQFASYLQTRMRISSFQWMQDGKLVGEYPGDEFHHGRHEERIDPGIYTHFWLDGRESHVKVVDGEVVIDPGTANHPVTGVSWFGAKAYCEFLGGRLPTEAEWEKAARGLDSRPFPWGDEITREHANYYSSRDLFEKMAGGYSTTPVGFYNGREYDGYQTKDGSSPYGLYDMAGNVWQWIGDVHEQTHQRTMKGGSKADYAYGLRIWMRNYAGPDYTSANVGFRCAR